MRFKILIPSLILAAPFTATADDSSDRVSISNFLLSRSPATAPSYRLDYNVASEVDFDDVNGSFSYSSLSLKLPLTAPIHFNSNNALLIGTSYTSTTIETDTSLGDLDLHDLRLNLRWIYQEPGSNWSWMTVISPGIATDGGHIGSDDFSVNGRIGFRYAKSDRFAWLGGVAFFTNSYENRIYPGLGFQWRPTDETQLDFTGISLKGSWQPSDDWIFRFDARPAGGTWNIDESGQSLDLDLDSYQVGIGMERRMSNKVWLGLSGGITLANELEAETSSGRRLFEEDADGGWFAQLGIRATVW